MGLDSVELLMAVEDTFGIQISDEDALNLRTPGRLADYVMARVRTDGSKNAVCASQNSFYALRSALMRVFGVPRNQIRPDTPLRGIVGERPGENWEIFTQALAAKGFSGPSLEPPRWFSIMICLGIPGVLSLCLWLGGVPMDTLVFASMVLALLMTAISDKFTPAAIERVPVRLQTVANLVPHVVKTKQEVWTRESVLRTIFLITSEHLPVPLESIQEDSDFFDDLGAD
ncbi:MAG: phosphopantetheine-binding protein [Burkholderiaceae bacterium]|nr:phosphopantetheine-binding protein [Burkholderiaceae bacterium]